MKHENVASRVKTQEHRGLRIAVMAILVVFLCAIAAMIYTETPLPGMVSPAVGNLVSSAVN